jgi:hypothetical protein
VITVDCGGAVIFWDQPDSIVIPVIALFIDTRVVCRSPMTLWVGWIELFWWMEPFSRFRIVSRVNGNIEMNESFGLRGSVTNGCTFSTEFKNYAAGYGQVSSNSVS